MKNLRPIFFIYAPTKILKDLAQKFIVTKKKGSVLITLTLA